MKTVVSIYCEGIEAKVAVMQRDKDRISIKKLLTVTTGFTEEKTIEEAVPAVDMEGIDDDLSFDEFKDKEKKEEKNDGLEFLADALRDVKLGNALFVPVVSEPVLSYHHHEGTLPENRKKAVDFLTKEIFDLQGAVVAKDSIDYVKVSENKYIAGYIEDEVPCVDFINALASLHKKRFFKIPAIKSAELSLASFYLSRYAHDENKYTLLIYAGKLYSKFIFFEGNNILHIGSTIDLGTDNLHTYDVYFSKILLEMENGNIPSLDNIIISGEGELEDLKASFEDAFPEALLHNFSVEKIHIEEDVIASEVNVASFTIPVAAAYEYVLEKDENEEIKSRSINILPGYVYENQKFFQFGWHSFAMLPLLFGATFYFTNLIMGNFSAMDRLDSEISRLQIIQAQNRELIDELTQLDNRVGNFDQTVSILDSVTVGTGVWSESFERISSFLELRRNFWITKLECKTGNQVTLSGYTLSRKSLTEFAGYYKNTLLNNIDFEPLRQRNVYSYSLTYKIGVPNRSANGS
ncbi:MAG: hypothetical protein SCALA702_18750 [Melioribacteraceae bacterium]|nr:MAG: hypothetical protein SCALA702_18750 [Melioribacteraceae bacterium]